LIASLAELRKAPLVDEEYHGPLLLSADASADTMRTLLGGGVTAHGQGWARRRAPTELLLPAFTLK